MKSIQRALGIVTLMAVMSAIQVPPANAQCTDCCQPVQRSRFWPANWFVHCHYRRQQELQPQRHAGLSDRYDRGAKVQFTGDEVDGESGPNNERAEQQPVHTQHCFAVAFHHRQAEQQQWKHPG